MFGSTSALLKLLGSVMLPIWAILIAVCPASEPYSWPHDRGSVDPGSFEVKAVSSERPV